MSKLILVTSKRSGAGISTVASILAEKLSDSHTVCLIDNNKDSLSIYPALSTTDSIRLYNCIDDNQSCHSAIKDSAAIPKNNLFFFSGGISSLTEEEIKTLKDKDIFDYIILDSKYEIDEQILDYNITVINPNRYDYETITKEKELASGIGFIGETFEHMIVVNRYSPNIEFKVNDKDFKLSFCPEIIDFANGYELKLPNENEKEVERIVESITGERSRKKVKPKFKIFGGKNGIQGNRKIHI